jgi:NADPH:quinone reductase-like Zn-dependent oxidoreductase
MRALSAASLSLDAAALIELPVPRPGPKEILIRISAVTLNSRDHSVLSGTYPAEVRTPLIPASDACGTVVALGSGASRFEVGDRVIPVFTQGWVGGMPTRQMRFDRMLGVPLEGVLKEYMTLFEEDAVACPGNLSDVEGAALPVAALTAWNVLRAAAVKPGAVVLLLGTGAVSLFALQFAKLAGATAIITSSSDRKLASAAALGADQTINYRTSPDWPAIVKQLTKGRGADVVVDTAGTFSDSLRATAFGGFLGVVGFTGGFDASFDLRLVVGMLTRIQGFAPGSRTSFEEMNRAISAHDLHPVIDRIFGFEDSVEALKYMGQGGHFGKIAIRLRE